MNALLNNKHILLAITGGVAAYKSADLVSILRDRGANVRVLMTESATQFVTPLTFQALSGHRVYTSTWEPLHSEQIMPHIELAKWPDFILVAPATANSLAKISQGIADDLFSTTCIASTQPLFIAPAMNKEMWASRATQNNVQILKSHGATFLGPAFGKQACGDVGEGRMLEPKEIVAKLEQELLAKAPLANKQVLITAGPTQESLDPVRYLSNHSSGKMGYVIADSALKLGAEVILITGPTQLKPPTDANVIHVTSANDMYKIVMEQIPKADLFISSAAVCDYYLSTPLPQKIKKTEPELTLTFKKTPDILKAVSQLKNKPVIIGFAAETENLIENATQKLLDKNLDMIAANPVSKTQGFNQDENTLTLITQESTIQLGSASKTILADKLMLAATHLLASNPCTAEKVT